MKKMKYNEKELAEIAEIQEKKSISRKSAIWIFEKDSPSLGCSLPSSEAPTFPL